MSTGRDPLSDPRFATLDAQGMVELCTSLAEYGEAGGLSRDLMLQVGGFAEDRFARDVEVNLAVARMYLLGSEATRACATLVRTGKAWPDESRVRPLLAHALKLLDDPRSVDEALQDRSAPEPAPEAPRRPDRIVPERSQTPPGLPAVKWPGVGGTGLRAELEPHDTVPQMRRPTDHEVEAAIAAASAARQTSPRRTPAHAPAESEPLAPTPASGMPIVPRAPKMPRGMGEVITASGTPSARAARLFTEAKGGRVAVARVPVQQAMPTVEVRTEVGRRAHTGTDPSPAPALEEPHAPSRAPRNTRIRLLDPDDEHRHLDPYELIGELASGGMATVFLGRLAGVGGFQRFVAIKRLHPHLARETQFVEMFLDEARLAAAIHHPHVVPILEVGQSDAGYYLVMEFIEGDTLGGIISRAGQRGVSLPPSIGARIVIDALAGLHAAHQLTDGDGHYLGLVHRDVTPQNILVGVDGSARITDFGVARAASRLAITRPQQVKGKVAYLSPEQAHALELDRRSDIFTMGIVLWEALTGRPLFQADTEAATIARLLSGHVPDVRSFAPSVPAALDEVCRRALALDRSRRFRTAAEMAEAIERAAGTESSGGVASPRELRRFVEGVMGGEIAAQREAVRAWLAQSDSPSPPMSRGPRSLAGVNSARAPNRRSVPPPTTGVHPTQLNQEARASRPDDDPPDTPAPRGEKVPHLSSIPPSPAVDLADSGRVEEAPATRPEGSRADTPQAPDAEEEAEPPASSGAEIETTEPREPDAPAEEEAPRPPRRALAPPWLRRLIEMKISNRGGALLVAVLVLIAVAPLAYKMVQQQRREAAAALQKGGRNAGKAGGAPSGRRPSPQAAPAATGGPAWDEWPVPEGGVPVADDAKEAP